MEFLRFGLLGLGIGALYALASQGLLVIYRGSGVLNFSQGAIGMVGAYLYWEMKVKHGLPDVFAWIIAVAGCSLIGAAAHMLVMRQLRRASPLARIVATLGMLIVIQSLAVLRYGARVTPLQSALPENPIRIAGINVSADRFILLGIAIVLTIGLHLFYKRTRFGHAQLGTRLGAGCRRRHPPRADRVAADRGHDQHRPRRAGCRVDRRLPQLPAGPPRGAHPRDHADRGGPVRAHTGCVAVAAGDRDRGVDGHPRPGPAVA